MRGNGARGRRRHVVAAGAAAVVLLVGVLALPVGAQAVRASATDSPAMVVSPNWSGYVATGSAAQPGSYTSVTGTWTVPAATCASGSGSALSTEWVGLGGYTTSRQEEVGTDTNCGASGTPVYFAWFELVPFISYTIKGKVQAGDTITGLVKILGPALVELQVQNQTRGWTFTRNITYSPLDTSTAEWITEAPATCVRFVCSEANLANFGAVTMTQISATDNGAAGTLNDPSWTVIPIQLVPGNMNIPTLDPEAVSSSQGSASSPAGATPGPVSSDGGSFSVTWGKKPVPNL
jgi:hypothetical protein